MRAALVVCVAVIVSACGESPIVPSMQGVGSSSIDIAGTWNGTIASSNNETEQVRMVLTQSGNDVSGSWDSSSVRWQGQISGAVTGSSFAGQLKFSGMAADGTVCTGTATVAGSVTTSTMAWTSANGVVGVSCPAALPLGLKIDLQRQ